MIQSEGAPGVPSNDSGRLDSWKEIAAYLRREVRTVQRWEKYEGLPVCRHQHQKRGSVYALKSELDVWQAGRCLQPETTSEPTQGHGPDEFPPAEEQSKSVWRRATIVGVFAFSLTLLVATGYLAGLHSRRQIASKGVAPAATAPFIVVSGDFNGDGKVDLAMARLFSNSISIFFGATEGRFTPQVAYSLSGTITGMAAGDFDRDGKADLAVAADTKRIIILLADKQTAFRQAQQIAVPHLSTISAGDLNGNGKVDLVASGDDSASIFVLWGNGDGSFALPQAASQESADSATLMLRDPAGWPER
jgi:FG-GAP-like repeat